MTAPRFVDTNVLLYAVSTVPEERAKAEVARDLLSGHDLALSMQVLQEFYVQSTRPGKAKRLTHQQATALIESFCRFPVQETTLPLLSMALDTKHRLQIPYWDAAIIAAARLLGCELVLSEDLGHGQDYAGVVVLNPFLEVLRGK